MRAHVRGTGLVLGLAVTIFGCPAVWADSATNAATNSVEETVNINETAPFSAAAGGQHLSLSLLALGIALGAMAAVGAIVWREVRR